jgi:hypothetical protein
VLGWQTFYHGREILSDLSNITAFIPTASTNTFILQGDETIGSNASTSTRPNGVVLMPDETGVGIG